MQAHHVKPLKTYLQQEVIRRNSKRQPAGWNMHKLCEWLHSHPPPPEPAVTNDCTTEAAEGGGGA